MINQIMQREKMGTLNLNIVNTPKSNQTKSIQNIHQSTHMKNNMAQKNA